MFILILKILLYYWFMLDFEMVQPIIILLYLLIYRVHSVV